MRILTGLPDVNRVGFLVDGRVITAGELRTVQLLDPDGRPPVDFVERNYNHLTAFGLSADGRWVYVHRPGESGIAAVDPASGKGRLLFGREAVMTRAIAADPRGPRVLLYVLRVKPAAERGPPGADEEWVCFQHAGAGKPKELWRRNRMRAEPEPVLLAFLTDDKFVGVEVARKPGTAGWVHHLAVRDANTADLIATVKCPTAVDEVAAAPDGSAVVTRVGTQLIVWPTDTFPKKPLKLAGNARERLAAAAVAFHPSGRYLAVAGNDPTVTFYDTSTWTVAKKYRWPVRKARSVAFSPDGTLAAAGSDTGKIVVWDVDG